MGILAIRVMKIRARGRAMGIQTARQFTWGHLRRARMATTAITPMLAYPTATTDLVGSRAEYLLALGRGAMAIVASTGDADLAAVGTTETAGALPHAEDSAVESVTVMPVEAEMSTVAAVVGLVADAASAAAVAPTVVVDVASTVVVAPLVEADVASAAVDVPLVVADAPSVEGGMVEVEVEAVPTVVGAGRLHH